MADPATRETEAKKIPSSNPVWAKRQVQGQPGQFNKILSQNKVTKRGHQDS